MSAPLRPQTPLTFRDFTYYTPEIDPLNQEPTPQEYLPDSLAYFHLDHLGTPIEMTDRTGKTVWEASYKAWGEVETVSGSMNQSFRFQGQYFDEESGLHYNRFRYYDPSSGRFVSQDPIGLEGGINLYEYAPNSIEWVDPFGLQKTRSDVLQKNWLTYTGCKHKNSDIHHGFPEQYAARFSRVAGIDVNNPEYYYNLPKKNHTKKPGIHTNSSRTGQNWNKTWDGILKKVENMNLSKDQAREFLENRLRELARKERISKYNAKAIKNSCCC